MTARQFIKKCLTIDPTQRMTAHEALSHPWISGPETGSGEDLLPTVKKNFNARRTLHKAIDTVRAINQLRAGGMTGMMDGALSKHPKTVSEEVHRAAESAQPRDDGDVNANGQVDVDMTDAGAEPEKKSAVDSMDPRGHGRGQTEAQIQEQQRRIEETQKGLWQRNAAQAA